MKYEEQPDHMGSLDKKLRTVDDMYRDYQRTRDELKQLFVKVRDCGKSHEEVKSACYRIKHEIEVQETMIHIIDKYLL